MTQMNLGGALLRQREANGDAARLGEAVAAYDLALEVYHREETPQVWAKCQNSRGTALWAQAELTGDAAQFDEAVTAYRLALEVRHPKRTPVDFPALHGH